MVFLQPRLQRLHHQHLWGLQRRLYLQPHFSQRRPVLLFFGLLRLFGCVLRYGLPGRLWHLLWHFSGCFKSGECVCGARAGQFYASGELDVFGECAARGVGREYGYYYWRAKECHNGCGEC